MRPSRPLNADSKEAQEIRESYRIRVNHSVSSKVINRPWSSRRNNNPPTRIPIAIRPAVEIATRAQKNALNNKQRVHLNGEHHEPTKFLKERLQTLDEHASPTLVLEGFRDIFYGRQQQNAAAIDAKYHLNDTAGIQNVANEMNRLRNHPNSEAAYNDLYKAVAARTWLNFINKAHAEGRADSMEDTPEHSFATFVDKQMQQLNGELNNRHPGLWNKAFPNKLKDSSCFQGHQLLYKDAPKAAKALEAEVKAIQLINSESDHLVDFCTAAIGENENSGFLERDAQIEKLQKQIGGMEDEQKKLNNNADVKKSGKDLAALDKGLERQELLDLKREKANKEARVAELQRQPQSLTNKLMNVDPNQQEIARLQKELARYEYQNLDQRIADINDYDTVEAGPVLDAAKKWHDFEKQKRLLQDEKAALASIDNIECKAYRHELLAHKTAVEDSQQQLKAINNPYSANAVAIQNDAKTRFDALDAKVAQHTRKSPSSCADVLRIAADNKPGKMPALTAIDFDHFALPLPANEKAKFAAINNQIATANEHLKRLKGLEIQRPLVRDPKHIAALDRQEEATRKKLATQIKQLNLSLSHHANSAYLASYSGVDALGKKVQALNKQLSGECDAVPTHNKNAAEEGQQNFNTVYFERDQSGKNPSKWKAKELTGDDGKPLILARADILSVIDDVNKTLPNKEKITWETKNGKLVVDCKNPQTKQAYISALKKKDAELKKAQQDPNAKADDKEESVGARLSS